MENVNYDIFLIFNSSEKIREGDANLTRERKCFLVTAAIGVVDLNGFSYLEFLCEGCDVKNIVGW